MQYKFLVSYWCTKDRVVRHQEFRARKRLLFSVIGGGKWIRGSLVYSIAENTASLWNYQYLPFGKFHRTVSFYSPVIIIYNVINTFPIRRIAGVLSSVNQDLLGWRLSVRQCDSRGLNERPEKQPDRSYSLWILSS